MGPGHFVGVEPSVSCPSGTYRGDASPLPRALGVRSLPGELSDARWSPSTRPFHLPRCCSQSSQRDSCSPPPSAGLVLRSRAE